MRAARIEGERPVSRVRTDRLHPEDWPFRALTVRGRRDGFRRPCRLIAVLRVTVRSACIAAVAAAANGDPAPGYYGLVDSSTPSTLRTTLHETIDDHLRFPYTSAATDTWDILEAADEDAIQTAFIRDVYKNELFAKNGGGGGGYNREHTWPSSYGFPDDNQQNYPYTDCHHLFLSDEDYNSSRSNKPYRRCDSACTERPTVGSPGLGTGGAYPGESNWTRTGIWETWAGRRGDVARALFYLDVRYDGDVHGQTGVQEPDLALTDDLSLVVVVASNAASAFMGELGVLLLWHLEDPVDDDERRRNDVVEAHQGNRNPFIDQPEWAACLFGGFCNDVVAPTAPTALQATGVNQAIDLGWNPGTELDIAGHRVWRSSDTGGPYALATPALVTDDHYQDTQVEGGTTYFYVITTLDLAGNESFASSEAFAGPVESPSGPWINEIHYDNTGADLNEGFEIAGLAGTDLAGWQVATYNGNDGTLTQEIDLVGVLADDGSGFGFLWFDAPGLQNGPADGLALVDPVGSVREFWSYEGVLTAVDGPALGLTSQDMGTSETSSTPVGHSLQRAGTGSAGSDFDWASPAPRTAGAVNAGQTLEVAQSVPVLPGVLWLVLVCLLAGVAALWTAATARRRRPEVR